MGAKAAKVKTKTLPVGSKDAGSVKIEQPRCSNPEARRSDLSALRSRLNSFGGFTLIEVLVVLVLMAALTAVAAPSIGRGLGAIELQTTARRIAATLRLARMKAVREQRVFLVGFDLERNEVELTREDLSFRRIFELPESVKIQKVTRIGDDAMSDVRVTCVFVPNGLSESFEVWLRNNRGRELKVVQDSFLKSPRIDDLEDSSGPALDTR
jgi:general secretion pathway protein H